jgi:hypothetical protein
MLKYNIILCYDKANFKIGFIHGEKWHLYSNLNLKRVKMITAPNQYMVHRQFIRFRSTGVLDFFHCPVF